MIRRGLKPNKATLAVLLSACAQIASLEKGKKGHDYIIELDLAVNRWLICMPNVDKLIWQKKFSTQ